MRRRRSRALPRLDGLQVFELALADDLNAARLDVLVVAREGETRLLHARMGHRVVEMVLAGEHGEPQIGELVAEELAHQDLVRVRHWQSPS